MNINLSVKLEAPELMAAILALAEALPQIKYNTVPEASMGQVVEPVGTVHIIEEKKEEVKAIGLSEVREKLAALDKAGKKEQLKALIKRFGASKLSDVPKESYPALLREAEAIYLN
jgi:hypothetical protein